MASQQARTLRRGYTRLVGGITVNLIVLWCGTFVSSCGGGDSKPRSLGVLGLPLNLVSPDVLQEDTSAARLSPLPILGPMVDRHPEITNALKKYYPKRSNLKLSRLMRKMGDDFDPEWMSITNPAKSYGSVNMTSRAVTADDALFKTLMQTNFSYVNERDELVVIERPVRKVMEKWLLQRASCHVTYVWLDRGVMFWPRWSKTGECKDRGLGCSWPPHMRCSSAGRRPVRFLRWYCGHHDDVGRSNDRHIRKGRKRDRKYRDRGLRRLADPASEDQRGRRGRKLRCRWMKVSLPIVTSCSCSCS